MNKGYITGIDADQLPSNQVVGQAIPPKSELPTYDHIKNLTNKKSITAKAQLAEYEGLKDAFSKGAEFDNNAAPAAEEFVTSIPKSKIAWVKALWNDAHKSKQISPADLNALENIYMNQKALRAIVAAFNGIKGLTITQNKAQISVPYFKNQANAPQYQYVRDDQGKLKFKDILIANPGVYEPLNESIIPFKSKRDAFNYINARNDWEDAEQTYGDFIEEADNKVERSASKIASLFKLMDEKFKEISDLARIHNRTYALDELEIDPKMQKLIDYARRSLMDTHISTKDLEKLAEGFNYIRDLGQSKYILQLIDPWKHTSAKIPTLLPIPTVNFTLRNRLNLVTNNIGNAAFGWNPFALFIAGTNSTTFAINNNNSLDGLAPNNNFVGQDIGQNLPADFYTRFRLVSAALQLSFTTSSLNSSGFCTMGVSFTNQLEVGVGVINPNFQSFGSFNNVENSYFLTHQSANTTIPVQMNYIPLDDSFTDFLTLNAVSAKGGYTIVGYVSGQPVSQAVARLDIVATYEATVAVGYTDYLPCSIYTGSTEDIRIVNKMVGEIRTNDGSLNTNDLNKAMENVTHTTDGKIPIGPNPVIGSLAKQALASSDAIKKVIIDKEIEDMEPKDKRSFWHKLGDYAIDFGSSLLPGVGPAISSLGKSILGNIF